MVVFSINILFADKARITNIAQKKKKNWGSQI